MSVLVKLYKERPVRIVNRSGDPWFVLEDVCAILQIPRLRDAERKLEAEDKSLWFEDTPSGKAKTPIISDLGLGRLAYRKRSPEAADLLRWLTHEVLPMISRGWDYAFLKAGVERQETEMRELSRRLQPDEQEGIFDLSFCEDRITVD